MIKMPLFIDEEQSVAYKFLDNDCHIQSKLREPVITRSMDHAKKITAAPAIERQLN